MVVAPAPAPSAAVVTADGARAAGWPVQQGELAHALLQSASREGKQTGPLSMTWCSPQRFAAGASRRARAMSSCPDGRSRCPTLAAVAASAPRRTREPRRRCRQPAQSALAALPFFYRQREEAPGRVTQPRPPVTGQSQSQHLQPLPLVLTGGEQRLPLVLTGG